MRITMHAQPLPRTTLPRAHTDRDYDRAYISGAPRGAVLPGHDCAGIDGWPAVNADAGGGSANTLRRAADVTADSRRCANLDIRAVKRLHNRFAFLRAW